MCLCVCACVCVCVFVCVCLCVCVHAYIGANLDETEFRVGVYTNCDVMVGGGGAGHKLFEVYEERALLHWSTVGESVIENHISIATASEYVYCCLF